MTRFVVLLVVVAGFSAGAVSMGGADAASHRAAAASRSATFPSWSPDGKQVLFGYVPAVRTSDARSRDRIVRTSSRPGGAIRIVHVGSYGHYPEPLFWAPGGRIVFRDDPENIWYSAGLQGGKPQRVALPGYPHGFILTPKRAYAAVTIQDTHGPASIALLRLRPGRNPAVIPTPLAAEEQSGAVSDYILSFSPHGRQLIFARYAWDSETYPPGRTGPASLMAFRLGGGAPVPLAQSGIPGAPLVPSDAQQVQWSPDGRWVAFVEGPPENQSLEVVPTTGASAPRTLPPCPAPARLWAPDQRPGFSWSPTSKLILYNCSSPDELMTVRPDGTHLTDPLADHPLTYVNWSTFGPEPAQWSPDGSRLLFLAHAGAPAAGDSHPTVHVWAIRPNGHDLTRLG